ncbi:hypothetical protein BDD21_1821 [Thiocapsa rosea]|uniref:Uncharacterized protein n=2 Tax=Thiocapsa rosea TaxID=69360 RepID=A0A495V543_9GAMM|nr:hypothetical protein BDD21_1821 [Thiocapsa rosea]
MRMTPIGRFSLSLFLWLPVCFGAWYFSSIILVMPIAWMLDGVMTLMLPSVISGVGAAGNHLVVETLIATQQAGASPGEVGEILFKTNPLKYGYSLPLYTALVLAAPETERDKILAWLVGALVLILVQVFGIGAEILKVIAFGLGAEGRAYLALDGFGENALALAYQLGYLILPPVAPIMLWMFQFRSILGPLTGGAFNPPEQAEGETGTPPDASRRG